MVKGRKVFVEGRISTRSYTAQDGTVKSITEIIISDMILLDSRRQEVVEGTGEVEKKEEKTENKKNHPSRKVSEDKEIEESAEEEPIAPDDIPF